MSRMYLFFCSEALFSSIEIPFVLRFITCYLVVFIFSDYENLYLLSILRLYHHLLAELEHLYNLPLHWVCWGHKRFLLFDCRVVWKRPSSFYVSHRLINLRSSTWGKFVVVLQNSTLRGPTESTWNKSCIVDIIGPCGRHPEDEWRKPTSLMIAAVARPSPSGGVRPRLLWVPHDALRRRL